MHLMYFTEQPMSAYPAQAGLDFGATALMFSNKHFDPVAGSRLYNEYIEQVERFCASRQVPYFPAPVTVAFDELVLQVFRRGGFLR